MGREKGEREGGKGERERTARVHVHAQTRTRIRKHTHIRTASSRTPEEARGESRFTFLFRALLFSPSSPRPPPSRLCHPLARFAAPVNERAHNQPPSSFRPLPTPSPRRRRLATLAGDGISHSKRPPASRSPTRHGGLIPRLLRASVLVRVSLEGI